MGLNVIGLVSGGKDSFFCLLHCLAQGHRIVALANLYPDEKEEEKEKEEDANSFMYQTVGHRVLPMYAAATGLPVYRQPIVGRAVQQGRDYQVGTDDAKDEKDEKDEDEKDEDETESMATLLRRICALHPDADAVCAGALLSTYQRTRVESVAARVGLISLAFLWQLPTMAPYARDPAAYLADLGQDGAGLDARLIKVASGGLDDALLWTDVGSPAGRMRLQRSLQRFGFLGGDSDSDSNRDGAAAVLGEGGEYETLVVGGPPALFRQGRLCFAEADRRVVQESGGSAWLQIERPSVQGREEREENEQKEGGFSVRRPRVLDARFAGVLASLAQTAEPVGRMTSSTSMSSLPCSASSAATGCSTWCVIPATATASVAEAAQSVVDQIRTRLATGRGRPPGGPPQQGCMTALNDHVTRTTMVLRRMSDFGTVNAVYGSLFPNTHANPPSRVAISCGDLLPADVDVAVYLTVLLPRGEASGRQDRPLTRPDRQGLHVQSWSYWAPANIGPYSQAISVPLLGAGIGAGLEAGLDATHGPRLVSIAGQIPLVPATMVLPDAAVEASAASESRLPLPPVPDTRDDARAEEAAPASFAFCATLALQHLWRIGRAVDVQWWSSAVVFVPRQADNERLSLRQKAVLAAQAWREAHRALKPDDEDDKDDEDEDNGPDLWDRTFNARYYAPGKHAEDGKQQQQLPSWSVLARDMARDLSTDPPPVFLAEVHELPRSAPVEWQAHAAFSHLAAACLERRQYEESEAETQTESQTETRGRVRCHATLVRPAVTDEGKLASQDVFLHAVRMLPYSSEGQARPISTLLDTLLDTHGPASTVDAVYMDASCFRLSATALQSTPIIPCASLWDGQGERLAAVVIQYSVIQRET